MIVSLTFKIIVTPERFPNIIDHWYLWLLMPMHFCPYPIRAANFILTYYIAKTRTDDEDNEEANKNKLKGFLNWLAKHPKYISHTAFLIYSWIIQGIAIIIGIVRNIMIKDNQPGNYGSGVQKLSYIIFLVIVVVVSIFLWICVLKLRSINDTLRINSELIFIGVMWIVLFLPFIGTGYLGLTRPKFAIVSPIFCIILCVVSFLVSFGMPVHMAIVQPPNIKLGTKILDQLEYILQDEKASQLLKDYLERQCCVDNYYFLKRVRDYQQITNPEELQDRYQKIMDTFINPDSVSHINISDAMTKRLLNQMSEGKPSSHSFNEPYQEIHRITEQNIAFGFKDQAEVKAYARELNAKSLAYDAETE